MFLGNKDDLGLLEEAKEQDKEASVLGRMR